MCSCCYFTILNKILHSKSLKPRIFYFPFYIVILFWFSTYFLIISQLCHNLFISHVLVKRMVWHYIIPLLILHYNLPNTMHVAIKAHVVLRGPLCCPNIKCTNRWCTTLWKISQITYLKTVCMYDQLYVCTYGQLYVGMYGQLYVCMYVCMANCMYVWPAVCMYVWPTHECQCAIKIWKNNKIYTTMLELLIHF